jgi:hypothetical protein
VHCASARCDLVVSLLLACQPLRSEEPRLVTGDRDVAPDRDGPVRMDGELDLIASLTCIVRLISSGKASWALGRTLLEH